MEDFDLRTAAFYSGGKERGAGCVIPILIVIAIGAAMFIAGFSCGARL